MALIIDKPQPSGVVLQYWNLGGCDFSVDSAVNSANIELRGYIDKQKRLDGFQPVKIEKIHVNDIKTLMEAPAENAYTTFYEIVKQHPEWAEATDDI